MISVALNCRKKNVPQAKDNLLATALLIIAACSHLRIAQQLLGAPFFQCYLVSGNRTHTIQTQQAKRKHLFPVAGHCDWQRWRNESHCHWGFSYLSSETWRLSSHRADDGAQVGLRVRRAVEKVNCDWQEEQSNYRSCQGFWLHMRGA